jgi:hypothetical protein
MSDPKAAVLTVLAKVDFDAQEARIIHGEGRFFLAVGPDVAARSEHPKPLANYAWANGARAVRHDYDLKLAEV